MTTAFICGTRVTIVPAKLGGNLKNVRWSANVLSDAKAVSVNWQWSAAVCPSFDLLPNVKPVDDYSAACSYQNGNRARSPEACKASVVAGALGSGST